MDPSDIVNGMTEFFDTNYKKELLKRVSKGEHVLEVAFPQLAEFDHILAQELLDNPDEVVTAAEIAVLQMELAKSVKRFRVRFSDLPKDAEKKIRNIRATHLGKLLMMKGIVRSKTDVLPEAVSARYECPTCGTITTMLQLDSIFKEPTRCSCGRKGRFRLISKELVDVQFLTLEESPDDLEGGEQPKRLTVVMKEDLVSPFSERRTNPGSKILVIGVTKDVPEYTQAGQKRKIFKLIFEANNFVPMQEDYTQIIPSEEEAAQIRDLAKDPHVYERLSQSLAPSIYGHERVKEALVLQLFGGVHKVREDGVRGRGDIHILLVGDPGAGKSQILKRIQLVAPKSRYVSGKGATGVGLTAAVVKDEFIKGYSLEAGALVLCNNGLCCIDEFDKMSDEDRNTIHEALEQQTVSIAKANIQATLLARTTVLAAANPKYGRFDPYQILVKQIELSPTLIDRFDLIFTIRDIPGLQKDQDMARFILEKLHQQKGVVKPEMSSDFLKKYIAFAKQNYNPVLTDEAVREIQEFYVSLRNKESRTGSGEIQSVPISPRHLEGMVRLAEASARVQLRKKVTKEDARRAISLLQHCLQSVATDPETGRIDIDLISTGVSASQRGRLKIVQDIISELTGTGQKDIPIEEIISLGKGKGLKGDDIEETIETLKRHGEIFEPKRGSIQKL